MREIVPNQGHALLAGDPLIGRGNKTLGRIDQARQLIGLQVAIPAPVATGPIHSNTAIQAAAQFPDTDASPEPVCNEVELEGTTVQPWGDGWWVRVFVLGTTCANQGLSVLSARVSTDGVVTLDGIQGACWYEQAPCVN